jgi:uncharacterized protein involved in outer membrane biogenesis
MADPSVNPHLGAIRDRAFAVYRSRRVRKTLLIFALMLVVFGLLGFFAAPPIIRSQIERRAGAALSRPVTLGAAHLNPYTLRLQLDRLHIGDRDGKAAFVDIDQAVLNLSWSSLFRFAPVLDELVLQRPRIRIERSADQRFNFTDIIERNSAPSDPKQAPARFSLSNISVHDGAIEFDDTALKATHRIEQLELGVPFIANLPSDTDVFVQPLLAMRVDGSPMRIDGHTKPFADSRDSTVNFQLDRLDLAQYLSYVPAPLPFAIPKGFLSGKLDLHFVQGKSAPQLQLTGSLQLDDFALDNSHGHAVARLGHGTAEIADVQPLLSRYHLGALKLDEAQFFYTLDGSGHANLDPLTARSASANESKAPPTDLHIASIALTGSAAHYVDAAGNKLDVANLHGGIDGLSTVAAPPAHLDFAGELYGGDIGAKGTLDIAAAKLAATLDLKHVDVVPLQALAASAVAARMTKGKLDTTGQVQVDWSKAVNVHVADAHATVSDLALEPQFKGHGAPVAWNKLEAEIAQVDLAARQVQLGTVTATDLSLDVQRNENRYISLLDLFTTKQASHKAATGGEAPWRWSIAHLVLVNARVAFTDMALGSKPVRIDIQSLKGDMDNLSDKLDEPRALKLEGAVGKGSFSATGKLQPVPMIADFELGTKQLDIAPFEGYLSVPLNVSINSARLTSNGKLHYDGRTESPKLTWRGNAALERVRVQDKLTNDDFLRWRTLSGSNVDVDVGGATPRVHVDGLVLSSFYARVIVNADGRMNLSDVVGSSEQAPVSVTRAEGGAAPGTKNPAAAAPKRPAPTRPPAPAAAAAAAAVDATTPPAADVHVGGITLIDGQLNYTDNFIKPNYTADLTKLTGKVGAFGTAAGAPPAEVSVQAALDEDSPVAIDGTINPLQPVAFLDIKGKANDVELTRLTAYSTKYTGYPITAGKLTVDVHYLLDQRKLSADNHIFITQLTFGEEDTSPGIQHMPVKFAVSLLEDSEGNVDINVPVSGSLDDPQFNLSGLVWRAIGGMIAKAITAPFRLLGAAFGGGDHEDLSYVEFDPGSDVLEGPAQERLNKVIAMLDKKTKLHLDVIGRVDPAKDEEGLRKFTVDTLVRREKALDQSGKNTDTSNAALAAVSVTPDEYPKYLKRAYKNAEFANKPKNFIGLDKGLEPEEMRSLLETSVATDADALRDLAMRRATAVQAWLKGKLDDKRYTLKDPILDTRDIDDKGKTTRVDFGLHQG